MAGGGSGGGGFESYLPIAAALAATVMTDGAASPALVEAMGSEAAAGAVVGGGVGALTGGGVAALTGQNVGQSALMGGLGGATLGYGMAPEAGSGLTAAGTEIAPTAANAVTPQMVSAANLTADPIGAMGTMTSMAPADLTAATGAGAQVGASTAGLGSTLMHYAPYGVGALALGSLMKNEQSKYGTPSNSQVNWNGGSLANFRYNPQQYNPDVVVPPNPKYQAQYTNYQTAPYQAAEGGVVPGYADGGLLQGGPVNIDFMGGGMYPQSQQQRSYYATPTQMPTSAQQTAASYEPKTNPLTGELTANMAGGGTGNDALKDLLSSRDLMDQYESQYQSDPDSVKSAAQGGDYNAMLAMNQLRGTPNANYAGGGIANLGGYSDGGRMLKGPGDGMSDSIPATIQNKQPARLADNEFVVPADVVSHLGNGSSDAGAKKLYAMMDKVRKARTGKAKQAPQINANKYMPA